jgi:hypothetical protein
VRVVLHACRCTYVVQDIFRIYMHCACIWPCSASHDSACFSLFQLILSHRTLLNQPKPADFSTSRTSPISFPSTVLIDHACTIERLVACMQRHAQQRKPRDSSDVESTRDSPTLSVTQQTIYIYIYTNNNWRRSIIACIMIYTPYITITSVIILRLDRGRVSHEFYLH